MFKRGDLVIHRQRSSYVLGYVLEERMFGFIVVHWLDDINVHLHPTEYLLLITSILREDDYAKV